MKPPFHKAASSSVLRSVFFIVIYWWAVQGVLVLRRYSNVGRSLRCLQRCSAKHVSEQTGWFRSFNSVDDRERYAESKAFGSQRWRRQQTKAKLALDTWFGQVIIERFIYLSLSLFRCSAGSRLHPFNSSAIMRLILSTIMCINLSAIMCLDPSVRVCLPLCVSICLPLCASIRLLVSVYQYVSQPV